MQAAVAILVGVAFALVKYIEYWSSNGGPQRKVHDDVDQQMAETLKVQNRLEAELKNKELELQKEVDETKRLQLQLEKHEAELKLTEVEKQKRALEDLERTRAAMRRKIGIDNEKHFNFAVTGQSGTGKSSLVNALRALKDGDDGAAKENFTECTSEITCYAHPTFDKLMIWDLPGAGTTQHPVETYYEDKVLHAFDAILVVTGDRILSVDLQIAKESKKLNKPVVVLRSKADSEILNLHRRKKLTMKDAADLFRRDVQENFASESKSVGLAGVNLMIISSYSFSDNVYSTHNDSSLKCMDEVAMLQFMSETIKARFENTTDNSLPSVFRNLIPSLKL